MRYNRADYRKDGDIAVGFMCLTAISGFVGLLMRPLKLIDPGADFKMLFYNSQIYF